MLQLFHTDVAKVDRDVAYVAMVVHVCFASICSQCFICFSDVCSKCVYLTVAYVLQIYMLQVFYLDVAYVCKGFQVF